MTVGQRPPWPLAFGSLYDHSQIPPVPSEPVKEGTCSKESQSCAPPLCTWQLIIAAVLIYKKQQSPVHARDEEQTVLGSHGLCKASLNLPDNGLYPNPDSLASKPCITKFALALANTR